MTQTSTAAALTLAGTRNPTQSQLFFTKPSTGKSGPGGKPPGGTGPPGGGGPTGGGGTGPPGGGGGTGPPGGSEDHQEAPVEAEVMGSWGETLLQISMGIAPSRTHSSTSSTFTACLTSTQSK